MLSCGMVRLLSCALLQCGAVCRCVVQCFCCLVPSCSVLQNVAVWCSMFVELGSVAVCCSMLSAAVCCSMLSCGVVCLLSCALLQRGASCCRVV